MTLWLRNRAQSFMKVALPAGATIVSVDVAGSSAKPVEGADGNRVPLLRPGFRPQGPYSVSFVYLQAGSPFARKGDMQITLPKMEVPINVVEWELFGPEQFRADRFGGNVVDATMMAVRATPVHVSSGSVAETVTVTAESAALQTSGADRAANEAPSQNVQNLQRRIAGVLPVRVDVPRSGTSHRFVRPWSSTRSRR